jgi:hypothetical protein
VTSTSDFIEYLKERRREDVTKVDKDEVYMSCIVQLHKRIDRYEEHSNKVLTLYHEKAWECEDLKKEMSKHDPII